MGSIPGSDQLVSDILDRAKREVSTRHLLDPCNQLVDFDQFLALLKNAMNVRKTKKDIKIIFDIFDKDKSGRISS